MILRVPRGRFFTEMIGESSHSNRVKGPRAKFFANFCKWIFVVLTPVLRTPEIFRTASILLSRIGAAQVSDTTGA